MYMKMNLKYSTYQFVAIALLAPLAHVPLIIDANYLLCCWELRIGNATTTKAWEGTQMFAVLYKGALATGNAHEQTCTLMYKHKCPKANCKEFWKLFGALKMSLWRGMIFTLLQMFAVNIITFYYRHRFIKCEIISKISMYFQFYGQWHIYFHVL